MNLEEMSLCRYTYGTPEEYTPVSVLGKRCGSREMDDLPRVDRAPFEKDDILFRTYSRGCILEIAVKDEEQFFGLGVQLKSVHQNCKKKTLRVNSDPSTDMGDGHAPVPFLLSTAGYGVFIDTARYCSVYITSHIPVNAQSNETTGAAASATMREGESSFYLVQKYAGARIIVDIPYSKGVDLYFFGGPTMADAVARYNLFSGGGCMPPMYGLGVWYRTYGPQANEAFIRAQTADLRKDNMPCDVYGLENEGWQTRTYSCSYVWDKNNLPDPDGLIRDLADQGFHTNAWQHIFIHPDCPFYQEILPYSGNYQVWGGLAPDFSLPQARQIFGEYQKREIVNRGMVGFKLDECDNSDYIAYPWSYPEASQFLSGMDGEQMHSLMGRLHQDVTVSYYEDQGLRSYHQVRSSHGLAAPLPYVLYSDLYDHRDYVRGMVNAGYSGLLWSPEVRDVASEEDLIRRMQTVIMSPMELLTIWFMPNAPWKQVDMVRNRENIHMENGETLRDRCRDILNLRMALIPSLCRTDRTGGLLP